MIPPIIFASYMTGGFVMNIEKSVSYSSAFSLEFLKDNFLQYIVGAMVFGVAMAVLSGLMTWILLIIFRRKRKSTPTDKME
jgi:uncharacterized protein (DUF2062 family)